MPHSSTSKPSSNSRSRSSAPAQSTSSTSHSSSSRSNPTPAAFNKDLSKVLGPDGKLLPEEKARRERLGLCSYCGEDHDLDRCPIKPAGPTSKEDPSSSRPTTPSKPTGSSSGSPQAAQVVDPIAEESDAADSDL